MPQNQQQQQEDQKQQKQPQQLPKVYRGSKNKDFKQSLHSTYQYLANYSHEATTVPPYVLYGIANSQHNLPGSRNQNGHQDPFISSMNGNWTTFTETVDSTPAFAEGVLNRDVDALRDLPDLNGKWRGDERLKHYLNNEGPLPVSKQYTGSGDQSASCDSSLSERDYSKNRSKAGYWMSTEKREEWIPYLKRIFLYNNYVPLFFRVLLISLCVIALAISARIFHTSTRQYDTGPNLTSEISQQPSTIMAICVQTIALVYLGYIAYDEFKSKPLGIRNPVEKMRLILLDLLFIIFSSANLSLSFNTLYDSRWVCIVDLTSIYPKVESICHLQQALCAFLFVILFMWVFTFSISIMRVIQKVSSPGLPK